MTYQVKEENNISTVYLNGEIDMDVTDKAKDVMYATATKMAMKSA